MNSLKNVKNNFASYDNSLNQSSYEKKLINQCENKTLSSNTYNSSQEMKSHVAELDSGRANAMSESNTNSSNVWYNHYRSYIVKSWIDPVTNMIIEEKKPYNKPNNSFMYKVN